MKKIILTILLLICAQDGYAQVDKMSRYVRSVVLSQRASQRGKHLVREGESQRMTVFVRTQDMDALGHNDCRILASWDDIHIVSVPVARIPHLASLPEITRIEAGQSCQITNDTSAHITRVRTSPNAVTRQEDVLTAYGLTGKGVVVGVMDIGFDMTHPTFQGKDRECRIGALWDQLDMTEGGVAMEVGRQYVGKEAVMAKARSVDADIQTHGTHTAGTAAGNGYEGRRAGMATESELCLVCNLTGNNKAVVPQEMWSQYTTATDMLGFQYICDYAENVGKPCVINFSEGSHEDMYDNLLYCQVLQKMTGPGRILCASAGNEGGKGTFLHKDDGGGSVGAFLYSSSTAGLYTMSSREPPKVSLSFYPRGAERVDWYYDTSQLSLYPDSVMADTLRVGDTECIVMMSVYPSCFDAEVFATELYISNRSEILFGSANMPVSLELPAGNPQVDMYGIGGYFRKDGLNPLLADYTCDHNILFPGTAESVICVGSTAYTQQVRTITGQISYSGQGGDGVLASFSSTGPTMNGTCKPDVVAPGVLVTSSHSSYWLTDPPQYWNIAVSEYQGRKYPWTIDSGTSMSAPVVTGIIALWLQQCPTLSPDDVRDVLAHSCTHPQQGLLYPNNTYGYGQIDALAGVRYINEHYTGIINTGVEQMGTESDWYDLCGRRVSADCRGIVIRGNNGVYQKQIRR